MHPQLTKQQRHRQRLRAAGLRPVQIWIPDRRVPGFAEECRRQARVANAAAEVEGDALDFIEEVADWGDDTEATE